MNVRTKAEFRAIREMVGMSQQELADALEVKKLSVKRWERPDIDGYEPPQDAWDVLDDARAMQRQVVDYAVGKAGSISTDMGGEPQAVQLPYWRTQDAYDAAHPDDAGPVGCANANMRLVADRLESFGSEVRFEYPRIYICIQSVTDYPDARCADDGDDGTLVCYMIFSIVYEDGNYSCREHSREIEPDELDATIDGLIKQGYRYDSDAPAEVTATEDDYIDGDRVTRMEVYAVLSMDL